MRKLGNAGRRGDEHRAEAVARIWLAFYVLILGLAIALPFTPDITTLAAKLP